MVMPKHTGDIMNERLELFFKSISSENKKRGRSEIQETLAMSAIGAFLGYLAFGSIYHGLLFGFLVFSISAVGNRISGELFQIKSSLRGSMIIDDLKDNNEKIT